LEIPSCVPRGKINRRYDFLSRGIMEDRNSSTTACGG
jgi:hypothetical protein